MLEYAKFFSNVFVEGFNRPDELGALLWGEQVPLTPVKERKWTQYIAVANTLIENDPAMAEHVATQVSLRTEHFYRTMPPASCTITAPAATSHGPPKPSSKYASSRPHATCIMFCAAEPELRSPRTLRSRSASSRRSEPRCRWGG